ncbi:transposase [Geofilum sp. OHC36d9]|uniref:transposase n=1 Tax=Geofilum sp. OHC36d9 TaxID=3458413 RepID=UPI004034388A
MSEEKFKHKYRIKSARHPDWDYANFGAYFVTICTHNRRCYFGDIIDGSMILSEIGKIVETEWLKTFEMRPDMNLQMGEYVIMPNHFHAIIIIGENEYNTKRGDDGCGGGDDECGDDGCGSRRDAMHCVSTPHPTPHPTTNKFGPQSKNLASIIRGFKIGVTKNVHKIHPDFAWQSRFYDRIIRNNHEFENVRAYIYNNPQNWVKENLKKR